MSILKRALTLVCLLSLAATPGFAQAPFTTDDALAATEAAYLHMVGGEFDAVVEMLDESIKPLLTGEALAAGYASEIGPAGDFVEIVDKRAQAEGDTFMVQLLARHENGQALMVCVFTPEGKLSGINIANQSPQAETADPLPLDLPEGAEERTVTLHPGTEKELTGALVLPADYDETTPAVVMAHGSGISDLDETIGPNKPFRDIAYGLAERGIASLRYDKLHYAHPELATADITIDDEYTDTVLEALRVLREEESLGQAYLLGHSEGGMLTPYLMDKSEGGFAGGVILAGTPRQLWELIYDQNIALLEGGPEETLAATVAHLDAEKEKLATLDGMDADTLRATTVFGMPGVYLQHMLGIDPVAIALENNAPLLILQGEEDFQVTYAVDFAAWQEGLADMGDLVRYKSYPGLSHIFMEAHGSIADAMEAYSIPGIVEDVVIADIAEWIHGQD